MKGISYIKKFFTLIELIVVIVVLGILAAIVIPNISSFQEEAEETAILSDARNIQTAVDMYMLDSYGKTPTKDTPTLGDPQIIELYGLQPDYLRDTPKSDRAKFWLDSNNTVWASMVDAPTQVNFSNGTLEWKTVDGATLYKIYTTDDSEVTAEANGKGLTFKQNVTPTESETGMQKVEGLENLSKGSYLVTAIDRFEFESAPTKAGTSYSGYGSGPEKDYVLEIPTTPKTPSEPANQSPTAVIGMNPSSNLNTATSITWSYDGSTDPENHAISTAEWKLDGAIQETMPTKLTEGTHTIELRVQDEEGSWSEKATKEVFVEKVTFTSKSFNFNGNYQAFTVPATGTYKLEVWGAQGADAQGADPNMNSAEYSYGGKGGYAYGEKTLNAGDTLYIYVGGAGIFSKTSTNVGGFNGGGHSAVNTEAYGGGGATDFRLNGQGYSNRIIVAGGGGGAVAKSNGGAGGGLNGLNGSNNKNLNQVIATGGTQNSGGTSLESHSNGQLGIGGKASNNGGWNGGGGGGGGYYGGAGGENAVSGGGGSSYINGLLNSGTTAGLRSGNGMAKITLIN